MRTREALEKKAAFQAAAQSASWGGETVASPAQQPGKLNKLFRKTSLAIAASTGDGSGSDCDISCNTASEKLHVYTATVKTGVCQCLCRSAVSSCFQKTETKVVEVGDGNFD